MDASGEEVANSERAKSSGEEEESANEMEAKLTPLELTSGWLLVVEEIDVGKRRKYQAHRRWL